MEPLRGARLWLSLTVLAISLLLAALESSVIATALVSISTDLGNFSKSSWIVTAYLMTYTGFLIIVARLSDIFGRKLALLSALTFFLVWSLACALAQTIEQLIIFRALQGIGGGGLFSLVFAIFPKITPLKHYGIASGMISGVFSIASILGPLVGGAIASTTTWRWVFFFNLPPGAIAALAMVFVFPGQLPSWQEVRDGLPKIDLIGAVLSLAALILLIFSLEQGGIVYAWSSPVIIATFVVSGICWISFCAWQQYLSSPRQFLTKVLPLFPTHVLHNRVITSAFVCAFLTGFPFMTAIIYLPQRFQIENDMSPVNAGLRLLPLLLVSAVASGVAGITCSKVNVASYFLIAGSALQALGMGLLSTLPTGEHVPAKQYGFQVLLGFGFGLALCTLIILMKVEGSDNDQAVLMGSLTQFRTLGGVVGIAVAQVVFLQRLQHGLDSILPTELIKEILQVPSAIKTLPGAQASAVRATYGEAFNEQTRIVTYISIAAFVASLFTWRRHPPSFADAAREQADQSTDSGFDHDSDVERGQHLSKSATSTAS